MSFCPGTQVGSPEKNLIGIPDILEGHNFLCRFSINVKFEEKL
jgi:hypothetical protein